MMNPFSAPTSRALETSVRTIVALLLALSLPVVSLGQEVESDPETQVAERPRISFGDEIKVKVVNVKVYVRDKKTGEPVTDLTVDDFELFEDKRPVAITNFYEVKDGERVDREAGDTPETERAPVRSGGDVLASHPELRRHGDQDVPADQRLHLVIYVDHQNIRPFDRNKVFRYAREFLRRNINRSDRVMLMSYNRGEPKVERAFTSDHAVISRALSELEKHTGGRSQYDSERSDLLYDIEEARDAQIVMGRVRLFAESTYNDLQFSIDALQDVASQLAGIPGRKAVLYVSNGLPMRAGEEMFHAADEKLRQDPNIAGGFDGTGANLLDSLRYDASRRFRELTRIANANDVAFYTIDAAGLRINSLRGAEYQNTNFSVNIDSIANSNMHSTIMYMADETGGQYIVNTNNFGDGFDHIARDFDHFYSLGYSPSHAGSGRSYNLEVKVNRKGVEVRHRQNYRDKAIETEMADTTLAGLRFGFQDNAMGLELVARDAILRDDGTYMVNVDLRIPIGAVTLLPTDAGEHVTSLRAWVQAADREGRISPVGTQDVNFSVKSDEVEKARSMIFAITLPLQMRSGDQRLSVGLRDDLAGRTSFLTRTIRVGSGSVTSGP